MSWNPFFWGRRVEPAPTLEAVVKQAQVDVAAAQIVEDKKCETHQRAEIASKLKAESLKGINHIKYAPEEKLHPKVAAELRAAGCTIAPGIREGEHFLNGSICRSEDMPCSVITLPPGSAIGIDK